MVNSGRGVHGAVFLGLRHSKKNHNHSHGHGHGSQDQKGVNLESSTLAPKGQVYPGG